MADENVLEKVLLGDTTAEVVEKINVAIAQINQNTDDLEEAGKIDDILVNGDTIVDGAKQVNIQSGANIKLDVDQNTKKLTISSTNTKNTAGASTVDGRLYPIGVTSEHLGNGEAVTYSAGEATYIEKGVLYTSRTPSIGEDGIEVTQEPSARVLNMNDRDELEVLLGNLAGGMRYRGTVSAEDSGITELPYNNENTGSGWGSGQYKQPLAEGDTLKVSKAGDFYVKYNDGHVNSALDNVHADVGDLFILSVLSGYNHETGEYSYVTWELIPSGDDGDVYSDDEPWTAGGNIMITAENSTPAKKITKSNYKITNSIPVSGAEANTIPTAPAVFNLVRNCGLIRLPISTNNFAITDDTATGLTTYKYIGTTISSFADFVVIQILDKNNNPVVADIKQTFNTTTYNVDLSFVIDTTKKNAFASTAGGVIIQRMIAVYNN